MQRTRSLEGKPLNHTHLFNITGPLLGQAAACEPILRSLPDWFGIEEAIVYYVNEIDGLPTFLALDEGEGGVGFMSVKQHFPQAAELYVLGVRPEWHGRGIGRALLARAEAHLRDLGVEYVQVKTLAASHPDPNYARTRRFYEAMGFRPLEVLPELWDESNPCLIMIKGL